MAEKGKGENLKSIADIFTKPLNTTALCALHSRILHNAIEHGFI